MGAIWMGVINSALKLTTGILGNETARVQQLAQAEATEKQAENLRKQAQLQQKQGELAAEKTARQRSEISRQFNDVMGRNRSLLGAGNVDPNSGSALDVAYGNIDLYSQDLAHNSWQQALQLWEANQNASITRQQANNTDAQASWLKQSAGSLGTSILLAIPESIQAFFSAYGMAGGSFGGGGGDAASSAGNGMNLKAMPSARASLGNSLLSSFKM